ncbi:MAG: mechanosensitive ion channel family protein [Methanomassiliicoccales archaeon]|nr:mechanosensitive ion channel family protein [Methanomassiliicoccales archaeon]
MSNAKKLLWSSVLVMLVLTSLSPALLASPNDVTVYQTDDRLTLNAGHEVSFQWVVYNNGTNRQLIVLELETGLPDRLTYTLEPGYMVLNPGDGREFFLNVTAGTDMYSTSLDLELHYYITDMVTLEPQEGLRTVSLDVRSIYGTLDRENKILGIWDNPLPAPLDGNWGAFAVSILIWGVVAFLIMEILGPVVHRITSKTASKWDDVIIEVIRHPLFMLIIVFGTVSSLEILELDPGLVADLELLYIIALVIIAAFLAYRLMVKVVLCYGRERCVGTESDVDDTLVGAVELLGKVIIPAVAAFAIAAIIGVDLGGLILGLGFLGLIVGYATQSTLSNLFSGLQLIVDRPFRLGDRVPLENGHTAEVINIGFLSTKFFDLDTAENVIVPNSLIENQVIINMSTPDIRYKVNVKVRVSSTEDPARIEELMMEASRRTPSIIQGSNAPVVRVSEIKEGRMLLTIFIWVDTVYNRHIARTDYRTHLVDIFLENGIEFALPRRMVWVNRE